MTPSHRHFSRKLPLKLNSVSQSVKIDKKASDWKYDMDVPKILSKINKASSPSIDSQTNRYQNEQVASAQEVSDATKGLVIVQASNQKPAYDLQWPPLTLNGTIPLEDGSDVMAMTGLRVPRFWEAPPSSDVNKIGTKVNGEETIFLMIASYRDFQCRETITSAFNRADHPERLFVGAVDQVVPGDIGCLDVDPPCSVNPDQPVCKYRDQISVFKMDAKYATGTHSVALI
jgi:hypothetical protein